MTDQSIVPDPAAAALGIVPRVPRLTPLAAAALVAVTALSGCSLKSEDSGGDPAERVGEGVSSRGEGGVAALGFPTTATPDPIRRPGEDLPPVTQDALNRLRPRGQALAKGAQVILVGSRPPAPENVKSGAIKGDDPYEIAAAVDRFQTTAAGKPTPDVLVVSGEDAAYAMPAAAWAARAGTPVLFVRRNEVPQPTQEAIQRHSKPNIYLLGPPSVISAEVEKRLGGLGKVTRIAGRATNPVESAVEFARFSAGGFGWNAEVPGRNYSLANASRPLDAAASAALGSNGVYAPLLVTDRGDALPKPLENYLLDVQPGFENNDPSQGLFNRVWILGNEEAVSTNVQARVDELVQLIPVDRAPPDGS